MKKYLHTLWRFLARQKNILKTVWIGDIYKVLFWNNQRPSGASQVTSLRIRPLGNKPVLLRMGTIDNITLINAFAKRFHLPPVDLPMNPIILDLGSNIGYTVLDFAHLYPGATIIGVEMDIDNYELATKNMETAPGCTLLNKAISVKKGVVSYNKNKEEDAYQISGEESIPPEETIHVDSITIGDIIDQYQLEHIHFVKMDIEGEEVKLFDEQVGDLGWLEKVSALNIEVHTDPVGLDRIIHTLEHHGFDAWKDQRHWSSVMAVKKASSPGSS